MRFFLFFFYAYGYQKLPQEQGTLWKDPAELGLLWKYIGSTAENVATFGQVKGGQRVMMSLAMLRPMRRFYH